MSTQHGGPIHMMMTRMTHPYDPHGHHQPYQQSQQHQHQQPRLLPSRQQYQQQQHEQQHHHHHHPASSSSSFPSAPSPSGPVRSSTARGPEPDVKQESNDDALKHVEAQFVNVLNALRNDPSRGVSELQRRRGMFDEKNICWIPGRKAGIAFQEGVAAIDAAHGRLLSRKGQPLPPFKYSHGVSAAASALANDIAHGRAIEGHKDSQGRALADRLRAYGTWGGSCRECVAYVPSTTTTTDGIAAATATAAAAAAEAEATLPNGSPLRVEDCLFPLLIDDGLFARPHFETLFNSSELTTIGVAIRRLTSSALPQHRSAADYVVVVSLVSFFVENFDDEATGDGVDRRGGGGGFGGSGLTMIPPGAGGANSGYPKYRFAFRPSSPQSLPAPHHHHDPHHGNGHSHRSVPRGVTVTHHHGQEAASSSSSSTAALGVPYPDPSVTGHNGRDNDFENAIVAVLNDFRTNPRRYGALFESRLRFLGPDKKTFWFPNSTLGVATIEGGGAIVEAAEAVRRMDPLPQLVRDDRLDRAAELHAEEQSLRGGEGHYSRSGAAPHDRLMRFGTFYGKSGEVIAYGPTTAEDVIAQLLIDDNVSDRGHRKLLSDVSMRRVGVSARPHGKHGTVVVVVMSEKAAVEGASSTSWAEPVRLTTNVLKPTSVTSTAPTTRGGGAALMSVPLDSSSGSRARVSAPSTGGGGGGGGVSSPIAAAAARAAPSPPTPPTAPSFPSSLSSSRVNVVTDVNGGRSEKTTVGRRDPQPYASKGAPSSSSPSSRDVITLSSVATPSGGSGGANGLTSSGPLLMTTTASVPRTTTTGTSAVVTIPAGVTAVGTATGATGATVAAGIRTSTPVTPSSTRGSTGSTAAAAAAAGAGFSSSSHVDSKSMIQKMRATMVPTTRPVTTTSPSVSGGGGGGGSGGGSGGGGVAVAAPSSSMGRIRAEGGGSEYVSATSSSQLHAAPSPSMMSHRPAPPRRTTVSPVRSSLPPRSSAHVSEFGGERVHHRANEWAALPGAVSASQPRQQQQQQQQPQPPSHLQPHHHRQNHEVSKRYGMDDPSGSVGGHARRKGLHGVMTIHNHAEGHHHPHPYQSQQHDRYGDGGSGAGGDDLSRGRVRRDGSPGRGVGNATAASPLHVPLRGPPRVSPHDEVQRGIGMGTMSTRTHYFGTTTTTIAPPQGGGGGGVGSLKKASVPTGPNHGHPLSGGDVAAPASPPARPFGGGDGGGGGGGGGRNHDGSSRPLMSSSSASPPSSRPRHRVPR